MPLVFLEENGGGVRLTENLSNLPRSLTSETDVREEEDTGCRDRTSNYPFGNNGLFDSPGLSSEGQAPSVLLSMTPRTGSPPPKDFGHPDLDAIYQQDEDGDTMLHRALILDYPTVLLYILSLTPSTYPGLNIQNNLGQSCLHLAVLVGQTVAARILLYKGLRLDLRDKDGNTALHLASWLGNINAAKALTWSMSTYESRGLGLRNVDQTLFHAVPQDGRLMNYEGNTCLHLAVARNNLGIVELLIEEAGFDPNMRNGCHGQTILHTAVEAQQTLMVLYLAQLAQVSLKVNTFYRCTALEIAKSRKRGDLVNILTEALANRPDDEDDMTSDVNHVVQVDDGD